MNGCTEESYYMSAISSASFGNKLISTFADVTALPRGDRWPCAFIIIWICVALLTRIHNTLAYNKT